MRSTSAAMSSHRQLPESGLAPVECRRGALYELTDAHPDPALEDAIRRAALTVAGVVGTDRCFVRKMGFDYYVELDVRMAPDLPLHVVHALSHSVQDAVRVQIPHKRFARVLVHPEPYL
jgi:divalent metal cation (Fe/Co/Zn/Cd) transporter